MLSVVTTQTADNVPPSSLIFITKTFWFDPATVPHWRLRYRQLSSSRRIDAVHDCSGTSCCHMLRSNPEIPNWRQYTVESYV